MADHSDPRRDEEEMKRVRRRERIYKGLEKMPLASFNFGEYRILRRFIEDRGCSEADITYIEEKIEEFNKRYPLRCKDCGAILADDPGHQC